MPMSGTKAHLDSSHVHGAAMQSCGGLGHINWLCLSARSRGGRLGAPMGGADHQLNNDLSEVAKDIRELR
jgi:hypothetical protein